MTTKGWYPDWWPRNRWHWRRRWYRWWPRWALATSILIGLSMVNLLASSIG